MVSWPDPTDFIAINKDIKKMLEGGRHLQLAAEARTPLTELVWQQVVDNLECNLFLNL